MKLKVLLIIILIGSTLVSSAQKEEVLLTIGDTKISKAEFERIYKKNNQNLFNEADKKTPEEYIDLFIDYKLKVIEAQQLKMDTNQAFLDELAGYRNELAVPYLTDIKYNEKQIHDLYERMKKEVNASHILLRIPQNASNEEAGEILEKIKEIRKEIINGKDFGEAAVEYSEDPSAKTNNGSLGFFSAFQMVAPFENAVYNMKVGEISEPVRTSFGYHLIKLNDTRENQGEIKVAHIMKMFPRGAENFDKTTIKDQTDSIYAELKAGADFAELAKKYSDDKQTAVQGGEMPWFSAGRIIPEFAKAAFAIENKDDFTKPIETRFGFHIIKKIDHRPVPSFEEAKADIENRIKRDPSRSVSSKKAFIEKLKQEYNYQENEENIAKLKDKNVGDAIDSEQEVLFSINDNQFKTKDLLDYLNEKGIIAGSILLNFESWVDDEITEYENERLEDKYPEFRYILQEYHDGILLFNIMEEKIWNFASQDTSGLQEYYEKNKDKYAWEERFKGSIITAENDSVREEADKYFAAEMSNSEVLDLLNRNEKLIEIKEGAWEKGTNPIVDYYVWNGPETDEFNSEYTFVRGDIIPPEPKTLNEARGLYISDYQNFLEKEWLNQLRKKYKIKVNKKLLRTISDA